MSEVQIIGRLLLAALCGALIGFEREQAQKSAGVRTHTLVAVGAGAFTITSVIGFEGGDESRVAAQIVTGIGFLGAGAIFREGAFVQGLTTAAGLWVVASLGMAAGTGRPFLAVAGTTIALTVLYSMRFVDEAVARRKRQVRDRIEVHIEDTGRLESILKFTRRIDEDAEQVSFKRTGQGTGVLTVSVSEARAEMVADMLASHKGVASTEVLSPLYWPQKKRD